MNPLIYIPGQVVKSADTLRALGLGPLLDAAVSPLWTDALFGTPDGERGQLVFFDCPSRPASSSPTGLNREAQVWREAAKAGDRPRGRYWIGWDQKTPPTPSDLRRSASVPGEAVLLLDGNHWEIAVSSFVPHRRGIDIETGEEIRLPKSEFLPYVERCREFESLFMACGETADEIRSKSMHIPRAFSFAAEALAMNYRTTPEIIDGLELLGDEEVFQIVLAATGILTMAQIEREKKTM